MFTEKSFKKKLEKDFNKVFEENKDIFSRADKNLLYLSYLAGKRDEGKKSMKAFLFFGIMFGILTILQIIPLVIKYMGK